MIANNKQDVTEHGEIDRAADAGTEPESGYADLGEDAPREAPPVAPPGCRAEGTAEAVLESLSEMNATLIAQGEVLSELGHRDVLFAQLHKRLAAYEQDERSRSFLEPLARKAAPIHRRLQEQASQARGAYENLPPPLRKASPYYWAFRSLEAARVELETLLTDFGIETFVASGSVFDRRCQEAVERVTAQGSHKTGEIARRIAPGLRIDGRVIAAERVAVYVARSGRQS